MSTTTLTLLDDAFYNAMSDHSIAWGDLLTDERLMDNDTLATISFNRIMDSIRDMRVEARDFETLIEFTATECIKLNKAIANSVADRICEAVMNEKLVYTYPEYNEEDDILENWSAPDLTLRKGIWENFPVTLIAIPSRDGTERYSVMWHRKNLTEWRSEKPDSLEEYMNYQTWCEVRLMAALKQYSHKYTVESARNSNEICVIAMVYSAAAAPVVPTIAAPVAPRRRALDILRSFPISWDRDGPNHYIKIHNKNIQTLAASKGKSVKEMTAIVHADLLDALAEADDCIVSAKPGFLCAVLVK
jgi:hypothetical protein